MSSKSNSIYKLICIQSQSILESSNSRQLRYIYSLEKAQGKKLGLAQSVCVSTSSHMRKEQGTLTKGNQYHNLPSDHTHSSQILLRCVFDFCPARAFRKCQCCFPQSPGSKPQGALWLAVSDLVTLGSQQWFVGPASLFLTPCNALWRTWIGLGVKVLSPSLSWDW